MFINILLTVTTVTNSTNSTNSTYCSNNTTGSHCFNNVAYSCVNGTDQKDIVCSNGCYNGKCITTAMSPLVIGLLTGGIVLVCAIGIAVSVGGSDVTYRSGDVDIEPMEVVEIDQEAS